MRITITSFQNKKMTMSSSLMRSLTRSDLLGSCIGSLVWISRSGLIGIVTLHYSNLLNTGLVWYSNGIFVSGCKMGRYLTSGLKTGLKKACLWSKMSGIPMVHQVTWLYHLNTGHPCCSVFRCSVLRWLLYITLHYGQKILPGWQRSLLERVVDCGWLLEHVAQGYSQAAKQLL